MPPFMANVCHLTRQDMIHTMPMTLSANSTVQRQEGRNPVDHGRGTDEKLQERATGGSTHSIPCFEQLRMCRVTAPCCHLYPTWAGATSYPSWLWTVCVTHSIHFYAVSLSCAVLPHPPVLNLRTDSVSHSSPEVLGSQPRQPPSFNTTTRSTDWTNHEEGGRDAHKFLERKCVVIIIIIFKTSFKLYNIS